MESSRRSRINQSQSWSHVNPVRTSRAQRMAGRGIPGQNTFTNNKKMLVLAVILLVAVGFALIDFLTTDKSSPETLDTASIQLDESIPIETIEEPTPQEIITEAEDPTPTPPSPTTSPRPDTDPIDETTGLDRSDLSITVLNGSGVVGAAAKMKDLLESYGYTVASVDNAEQQDYAETVIETNESTKKYRDLLEEDLSESYKISSTSASYFGTGARIIVGKK